MRGLIEWLRGRRQPLMQPRRFWTALGGKALDVANRLVQIMRLLKAIALGHDCFSGFSFHFWSLGPPPTDKAGAH
jgi:hypothetical protein